MPNCECCGSVANELTQITSGQKLCPTCMTQLQPPPATASQLKALRRRGLNISENITRDEAKRIKDDALKIVYYVNNIWKDLTGYLITFDKRISHDEVESFCYQLAFDPSLSERLIAVEKRQDELTEVAFQAEMKKHKNPELFAQDFNWWRFRPPLSRDETYFLIEKRLRQTFGSRVSRNST